MTQNEKFYIDLVFLFVVEEAWCFSSQVEADMLFCMCLLPTICFHSIHMTCFRYVFSNVKRTKKNGVRLFSSAE